VEHLIAHALVVALSREGALIECDHASELPQTFTLKIGTDCDVRRSYVMWRAGSEVGLRLKKPQAA
jgi:hypothetical protein